jgi:hypothetical protein
MAGYQYSILRFIPNVIRDEGINVGVLVRSNDAPEFAWRFLARSAALKKLSPNADTRLVDNFQRALSLCHKDNQPLGLVGHPTDPDFFARAREEYNGNLQLTDARGLIANHMEDAIKKIFSMYVAEPRSVPRPIAYQVLAPQRSRERLWRAFEKRNLLRKGFVQQQMSVKGKHAEWTFDLGYRNGKLKLINSVALNADNDEAILGRALVLKGMVDEVRATHSKVQSTAVVDLPKGTQADAVREAQKILKDAEISVFDFGHLDELLATVQEELS